MSYRQESNIPPMLTRTPRIHPVISTVRALFEKSLPISAGIRRNEKTWRMPACCRGSHEDEFIARHSPAESHVQEMKSSRVHPASRLAGFDHRNLPACTRCSRHAQHLIPGGLPPRASSRQPSFSRGKTGWGQGWVPPPLPQRKLPLTLMSACRVMAAEGFQVEELNMSHATSRKPVEPRNKPTDTAHKEPVLYLRPERSRLAIHAVPYNPPRRTTSVGPTGKSRIYAI